MSADPYPPDTKWRVASFWCKGEAVYESGHPRLGESMPPHGCTDKDCRITTISGPIAPPPVLSDDVAAEIAAAGRSEHLRVPSQPEPLAANESTAGQSEASAQQRTVHDA